MVYVSSRKCCLCDEILKTTSPQDVNIFKWQSTILNDGREFWFCQKHSITEVEIYIKRIKLCTKK